MNEGKDNNGRSDKLAVDYKKANIKFSKLIHIYVRRARATGIEADEVMKARLEKSIMNREPEAYAFLILNKLDEKAYSEAKQLALELTVCGWKELAEEWRLDWWAGKNLDIWSGSAIDIAIVSSMADCFVPSTLSESDREEMAAMIFSQRPDVADFLDELKNG